MGLLLITKIGYKYETYNVVIINFPKDEHMLIFTRTVLNYDYKFSHSCTFTPTTQESHHMEHNDDDDELYPDSTNYTDDMNDNINDSVKVHLKTTCYTLHPFLVSLKL